MDTEQILDWASKYKMVYLFGTGYYGKPLYAYLRSLNVNVSGFVVSSLNSSQGAEKAQIVAIQDFREIYYNSQGKCGLILAIGDKYYNEVVPMLSFAYNDVLFLQEEFKMACRTYYFNKLISSPYDSDFYQTNLELQMASAGSLLKAITTIVQPKSVIDVGCGIGLIANRFLHYGAAEFQRDKSAAK